MSKPSRREQQVDASRKNPIADCLYMQCMMKAEGIADEIISDARKRKVEFMKGADTIAEDEIDNFKEEREKEITRLEAEAEVSCVEIEETVTASTNKKLQDLLDSVEKNKEAALERLLSVVLVVEPELHINLQMNLNLGILQE